MAHEDGSIPLAFRDALHKIAQQLFDALLAAAHHAAQTQLAIQCDGQHGLHVQLHGKRSRRRRNTAAFLQRRKVVDHELIVQVLACAFGPFDHLAGRKALLALLQCLVYQHGLRRARLERIHQVQFRVGILLLRFVHQAPCLINRARKAGREGQVHGGHTAFGSRGPRLLNIIQRNLRRRGKLPRTHAVVEFLRRDGGEHIIEVLLSLDDIWVFDQIDAGAVHQFHRQIATRINDEIALRSQKALFLSHALSGLPSKIPPKPEIHFGNTLFDSQLAFN